MAFQHLEIDYARLPTLSNPKFLGHTLLVFRPFIFYNATNWRKSAHKSPYPIPTSRSAVQFNSIFLRRLRATKTLIRSAGREDLMIVTEGEEQRRSMESVYLETTLISYRVARPSRDLLIAAHQQATRDWWAERRESFECYVSQVVIDEVSGGDPEEAKTRLAIISSFPVLEVTEEAEFLAEAIVSGGVIPRRAVRDAAHIAIAAVNGMDYLLTWNCKHLANAQIIRRVGSVCNREGYDMPVICTPEELMGE